MGNLGFGELLIIAVVVLLFTGSKRLPELGRSLGQSIREFQRALKSDDHDDQNKPDKKDEAAH